MAAKDLVLKGLMSPIKPVMDEARRVLEGE